MLFIKTSFIYKEKPGTVKNKIPYKNLRGIISFILELWYTAIVQIMHKILTSFRALAPKKQQHSG